jgi:heterodisulfide reductase subunit A-like polyferredoxin
VLVVGSGIGGIQSSLELADAGFKVYLLDEGPAIGGVMAMLDKTFPTNDCSMCILSPKLVGTGRHQNIELVNYSELLGLEGEPGHFRAKIRRKPRFVLLDKCTGCMDCTKVCPVACPDEYNQRMATRRAVYKLYPQAIPNAVVIEKNDEKAPCRLACPSGVNAQGYVALISQRKFKEAYELVRDRLPFPGICGRVCHHPCEQECNRKEYESPVSIRTLKRFAADFVYAGKVEYPVIKAPAAEREEKVAVVGAGPAGLTCALDLRAKGYKVTVFDAADKPGGMMRWGIPAYRLPRETLDREIKDILDTGVELKLASPVNGTAGVQNLLGQGFSAAFVALGCGKSRTLKIDGMNLGGVLHGIEFLHDVNAGKKPAVGNRVVVIGGGNVAVDVALCARRLGAEDVTMVCLECRAEMPAHEWEIADALAEGVKLNPSWGPQAIAGENGKVTGLRTIECTRVFDDAHRFSPEFGCTEGFVPADTVILAIGQAVDADGFDGFERGPGGTFKANRLTFETGMPGVFAGGDMVSGPASVIEAVNAGHEAAISIDRFINRQDIAEGRAKPKEQAAKAEESAAARAKIERRERAAEAILPVADRTGNFREVAVGFTEEEAVAEAQRCLNCGICSECLQCVAACEAKAIDHSMTAVEEELEVGAVVLSAGFKEYKPTGEYGYGYGRYPNVVTSLEFERILSASGPYEGHVRRPSDSKQPKKVAWIQCVGSRNAEHFYCSSVCCMYATKEAVIAREHCGGDLDCHVYYMDMRCFGKDFEKYYNRAKDEYGIQFRRCKVSAVQRKGQRDKGIEGQSDGTDEDLLISYEDEAGTLKEEQYDMVVVSTALAANPRVVEMAKRIGVATDEQGFVKTDRFEPVLTSRAGVYACGALTEPKDIPETVTEATGAASAVSSLLAPARNTLVRPKVYPPFRDVSGEEPRIGVFICNCGINIGGVVKVPSVVEYARTLPNVVYADDNLFTCSQDTQQKMRTAIEEHKLNRVIVASCTPRTHEPLFQETLAEAGLNPYLFTMANIRDQCSWVHMQEPAEATAKAEELVRMAVANSRLLRPLQTSSQAIVQKALVIGGGLAGMTAALAIADQGFEAFLVERSDKLGGNLFRLRYNEFGDDIEAYRRRLEERLRAHSKVKVFTGAELTAVTGYVGNYRTTVRKSDQSDSSDPSDFVLEHGVIVVATGADEYRPIEFLYGKDERVITQTEFEQVLSGSSSLDPSTPRSLDPSSLKHVVMIQCVGSREKEHPWCSRVCCTEAVKNAIRVKQQNPKTNVYILYRDMRTYGFKEALYRDAREAGVMFVRFDPETKPEVTNVDGTLHVSVHDPVLQRRLGINADLLVLSAGVVPPKSNHGLAQLLKVPLNEDGFFLEAHMKLRPVDFTTRGVFMAGMAHSPRRIPETVAQAYAAAARACSIISRKELSTEAIVAEVNPRWCQGCGMCEEICQYEAARLNPETGKSEVAAVLCQGCGACAAACPSEAIKLKGFEAKNVISMVDAAL